jgi:hypothetical protein
MSSASAVSYTGLKSIIIMSLSACFSSQMSTLEVLNRQQSGNCRQEMSFLGRYPFCVISKDLKNHIYGCG